MAHSIDVAPTILTACGLKPAANLPGVNLLDTVAVAKRDTVYGENFTHNAIDIAKPVSSLKCRWLVQGYWKLIVPNTANMPKAVVELYDLKADPTETTNLATKEPERVTALQQKLDAWWKP